MLSRDTLMAGSTVFNKEFEDPEVDITTFYMPFLLISLCFDDPQECEIGDPQYLLQKWSIYKIILRWPTEMDHKQK